MDLVGPRRVPDWTSSDLVADKPRLVTSRRTPISSDLVVYQEISSGSAVPVLVLASDGDLNSSLRDVS